MTRDDLQTLGFPSWLNLYQRLQEEGYQDSDKVKMQEAQKQRVWQPGDPEPLPPMEEPVSVVVVLEFVKARAFEELYATLPSVDTQAVLLEIAAECTFKVREAAALVEYLTKHPTRV